MHGKPFVPCASLIPAKAQKSRAKDLKNGTDLVQSPELWLLQELGVTG